MNRQEAILAEFIEELLEYTDEEIYELFGTRLEKIVDEQKGRLRLKLKTIWRLRKHYAFKDTGEQFDDYAMKLFFDPKKIKHYPLDVIECILTRLDHEAVYSNPKKTA